MLADMAPEAAAPVAEAAEDLGEAAEAAAEAAPDPKEVEELEAMAREMGYELRALSEGGEEDAEEMSMDEKKPMAASVLGDLAREVSDLRSRIEAGERAGLIRKFSARMTPGQRKWASTQPLSVLSSFVETLPPAPAPFAKPAEGAKRPGGPADEDLIALSRATGKSVETLRGAFSKEPK